MGRGDGADVDEREGGGVESPRGEAEIEEWDAHCCGGGGREGGRGERKGRGEGRGGRGGRAERWAEGKRRYRVGIKTIFIHHEIVSTVAIPRSPRRAID